MSSERAMKKLKSVWSRAGLEGIPSPDEITGTMSEPAPARNRERTKSARTARLDLRITAHEKKRVELLAIAASVTINEIFSRMLTLYEREHGRVELTAPQDPRVKQNE